MKTIKIFIASSSELKEDRDLFRKFIGQENDRLHEKGIYLEIVQWENFLDAISNTRLQDEYNNAIRGCDIVLCLFFTKVGKYTAEEFDTAYQVFKDKGKPIIWPFFKNAQINTGSITDEINTLLAFKKKIGDLGHFYTEYTNIDNLINKYRTQLDRFLPQFEEGLESVNTESKTPKAAKEPVKNTFNDFLTGRLIQAIGPYNKKANDFLTAYSDWEINADLVQTAKRIIISGYVGGRFFRNAAEESTIGFADLLRILIDIFSENNLELPIPQLKELQPNLQAGSGFLDACANLHSITELLKNASYTSDDCSEAEKNLVLVLENLNFLAEYKMISIKDIGYDQQRNDRDGLYLHNYTLLEGDSQANNAGQGKVRKETSPVISYAVLLFKENYRQNINMVPFIIDYNGLAPTGGSKICFYSFCNTYDDLDLNYSFIEDNSKVTIKKSKNPRPDDKDTQAINRWLANPENRKDMNFDNVFNLFKEAKKTLAGIEEETTEDPF